MYTHWSWVPSMHLYHSSANFLRRNTVKFIALFSVLSPLAAQQIDPTPVQYHTPYRQYSANLQPVAFTPSQNTLPPALLPNQGATLHSEIAYVQDIETGKAIYQKNSNQVRPIASITKLMTALIVLEAQQDLDEVLEITSADIDRLKNTTSRLAVGSKLSRTELLHLALMSSENRAANALGRHYPGGLSAFVRAMNDRARSLGMRQTIFVEPTGLSSANVSSPNDLVLLLKATAQQPLIHRYSTDEKLMVTPRPGRQLIFGNTNRLVQNSKWDIQVSKTGFINEAGQCLVLMTKMDGREVAIILMNSQGRYSRIGDAIRLRNLVESSNKLAML